MNPRVNYEMSESQLKAILEACKPTPAMFLSGGESMFGTPQENANAAWAALGKEMGFDSMTVEPGNGGMRFFSAVPSETPEQTAFRKAEKDKAERAARIQTLEKEIANKQDELTTLKEQP